MLAGLRVDDATAKAMAKLAESVMTMPQVWKEIPRNFNWTIL
jgi:hypothetical protein